MYIELHILFIAIFLAEEVCLTFCNCSCDYENPDFAESRKDYRLFPHLSKSGTNGDFTVKVHAAHTTCFASFTPMRNIRSYCWFVSRAWFLSRFRLLTRHSLIDSFSNYSYILGKEIFYYFNYEIIVHI